MIPTKAELESKLIGIEAFQKRLENYGADIERLANLWIKRHEQTQLAWHDLRRLEAFLEFEGAITSGDIVDAAISEIRVLRKVAAMREKGA